VPRLEVGQPVQTAAGQRRVLALPDGSMLFVNERTTARLSDSRHLALTAGEVFVEVVSRGAAAKRPAS
jgi:ferric-dicitrate binding protein FerR (iron transport regulator)